MRAKRIVAVMTATTVALAAFVFVPPGVACADTGDTTTTNEITTTLDRTDARNNGLIADAAASATDADSAAQTATADLPIDPTKGVTLKSPGGQTLTIGLPNANKSGRGTKTRKGAVAYSGKNGSANAVIPTEDGVQFLTTIKNRKAPTSYAYPITLPSGGKIEVSPDGTVAAAIDVNGELIALVPQVYAKDANGRDVSTRFTTDGRTLTQVVDHKARGVTYPVVADPWWFFIPAWILRSCGIGFLGGWAGAWVTDADIWGRFGAGIVGCIFRFF